MPLLDRAREEGRLPDLPHPYFAKERPTMVWWDWSTAGKDVKPEDVTKDKYGEKTYDKMKGDFRWEKDVVPAYFWYDGSIDRYLAGDKIDPSKVVKLSAAMGSRKDRSAEDLPLQAHAGEAGLRQRKQHDRVRERLRPPGKRRLLGEVRLERGHRRPA